VPLQTHSYPIWIDDGLLKTLPELLQPLNQGQTWVIFSQDKIYKHYGHSIHEALKSHDYNIEIIFLPKGEDAKSFSVVEDIFSELLLFGCDRSSTFLALGGGVVGDVTGFLAAIFMRGVDYIQIPTSLLAMIDSSIGGKTGINLSEGKNLAGAFWHPKAVVVDTDVLASLPEREMTSAMGEIIKYGAILDRVLLELIEKNIDDLLHNKNSSLLTEIISICAQLKSDVIVSDEREISRRRILNFGHTIGHALETYFGFDTLRHGEAISYGMIAAGKLSNEYLKFTIENFEILKNIIKKLPLPDLPAFDSASILKIMQNDKKIQKGNLQFVLLEDIGHAVIQENVNEKSIINVLENL